MNYLRSSQGPKSSAYYRRAIPAVAMVVLFLLRGPITNVLFPIILRLAEPLWNIRNILVGNPERENIFEANRVLEARLVQVAIDTDVRGDTTSAHILSSLAVSPYGTILIDKGLRQDIELGDTVVTGEGISLGKVVEVFDNSAKVSLYSVYGESLEVSTEDGTRFIVVGAGNQNFEARLPSGMPLAIGEYIYIPGASHYILAKIENVQSLPGAAFQKVFARSPLNIHAVQIVYIRDGN